MNVLIFRRRKTIFADGTTGIYHRVLFNSYNLGSMVKRQDGRYESSFGGKSLPTLRRARRYIVAKYKDFHGLAFAGRVRR